MMMFKKLAMTAATVGALAAATPSQAVITTFASFQPTNSLRNIRWQRQGTANGTMYTTATPNATAAGAVDVKFSFLQNYFVANNIAQDITAKFTLTANTSNDPAQLMGGQIFQKVDGGSFSFISTSNITVGTHTYLAGSNLLSGTFSNASLNGQDAGTAGGVNDSGLGLNGGPGSEVSFTSDFLDFNALTSPTVRRDFALSLTGINPTLAYQAGRSLQSFRATAGGSFSSDPAPIINGVPEPAIWGMMIAGFGVVGFQSRRRRSIKTVTA